MIRDLVGEPRAMMLPARSPTPSMIIFVPIRKALVISWGDNHCCHVELAGEIEISWSMTAVIMGSRPEVGSSLKSNSGRALPREPRQLVSACRRSARPA